MKPPTWEQLQALMPWAHIECSEREEAEIIIYTGLTVNEEDEVVWMPDMKDAMENPPLAEQMAAKVKEIMDKLAKP